MFSTIPIRQTLTLADLIITNAAKTTTATIGIATDISAKQLYDFEDNAQSIISSTEDKETLKKNEELVSNGDYDSIIVSIGSRIKIPVQNIDRDLLFKFNKNIVETTSLKGFVANKLKDLLEDQGYRQTIYSNGSSLLTDNLSFSVVIYSKSLGEWVDVSPYLMDVDTNQTKTAGAFSFNLLPVEGEYLNGWKMKKEKSSVHLASIQNKDKTYFEKIFFENDVVLIRLTRLDLEKDLDDNEIVASTENNPKVYDMIGLIDNISVSTQYEGNDLSVSISGRDLTKLLIEDGAYFFYGQVGDTVFVNEPEGSTNKRTRLSFSSNSIFSYAFKTIEDTIQFIIAKYSTTGLIPDDAFRSWGNRRSTKLNLSEKEGGITSDNSPMAGVWSLIEFAFDESVKNRLLTDNSIAREQGSVLNAINKICQAPFVEFSGDTYGDKFVFSVRKPPFDKLGTISWVYGDVATNSENDLGSRTLKKVDVRGRLSGNIERNIFNEKRTLSHYVIDIDESEVLAQNLSFSNEVYSWYRLTPKYRAENATDLSIFPPVSFEEYTQYFGARASAQEIYYVNYNGTVIDKSTAIADNNLQRQFVEDLKYVIESSSCLPFTREGSITIHLNRTIKRGTFIYFKPSNEVFYVDSVSHSVNISATTIDGLTTLSVKRGMIEPYIKGKNGFSYFNIIETGVPSSAKTAREAITSWKVNKDVFEFFAAKRQFA